MSSHCAMSVILTTPDNFETIRMTLTYMSRQSIRELLEIVIVGPNDKLEVDGELMKVFHSYQVVTTKITSIGKANAQGIRLAKSKIVALAEDHSFPEPNWAEKLVQRHREEWSVVAPAVYNANPSRSVSWADLFIGYGPWLYPSRSGERTYLPGHNSSYKKAVLLEYGDQLESMMDAETVLHWDLHRKGHRLYLEADARIAHTNFSLWSSWVPLQFYNGRLFAGIRRGNMSLMMRIIYTLGSPLIPLVRLIKICRSMPSIHLHSRFFCCLHAMVIGLSLDGMGQMFGYAFGGGKAFEEVSKFEFHRTRHISEKDQEFLINCLEE